MSLKGNNSIKIVGRLGQTPKMVGRNKLGAAFTVAVQNRIKNQDTGRWEDAEPFWIDVEAWGNLAARVLAHLKKGEAVQVAGYLKQSRVEKDGGSSQVFFAIVADSIEYIKFLPAAPQDADGSTTSKDDQADRTSQPHVN